MNLLAHLMHFTSATLGGGWIGLANLRACIRPRDASGVDQGAAPPSIRRRHQDCSHIPQSRVALPPPSPKTPSPVCSRRRMGALRAEVGPP